RFGRLVARTVSAPPTSAEAARRLLLEITRCPNVATCRSALDHPCAKVVGVQRKVPDADFRVPEPWNGSLARAPLLFVASNPSLDDPLGPPRAREVYPTPTWTEADTADFFENRFGGGSRPWTLGLRTLKIGRAHV